MMFKKRGLRETKPARRRRLGLKRPRMAKMNAKLKQDLLNLPNMLTFARVLMIPLVVVFLSQQSPLSCTIAAILFAIAAATDFFDGYLARKLNLVSLTGKFLDPLADKIMVMAACVQLCAMGWLESWVPIVLLAREFAVQGLRQIASAEGLVIAAGTGGKLKTALQLVGLIGLLLHYQYDLDFIFFSSPVDFHLVGWWMLVASIFFSIISAGQYFAGFLGAIKKEEQ